MEMRDIGLAVEVDSLCYRFSPSGGHQLSTWISKMVSSDVTKIILLLAIQWASIDHLDFHRGQ